VLEVLYHHAKFDGDRILPAAAEGDRINRSRQILTRKRALWVSYSTPDLALIGKRGSLQEPPKVKICQKLWFSVTGSQHNEHIHMKFGA